MSYLDLPRLNFKGRFYTNVSTINNLVTNYPEGAPIRPLWNPTGLAEFKFNNCTVTGVEAPAADGSLNGATVTTLERPPGKMVDLDTAVQQLSQLFGVAITLATSDGSGFTGMLTPPNFQDLWTRSEQSRGDAGANTASVIFVSTIDNVRWTGADSNPVLGALRDATVGSKLAIRITIGAFYWNQNNDDDPDNGYGMLVGSIGPHMADDPTQFVRRRLILPQAAETSIAGLTHAEMKEDAAPLSVQACNFHLHAEPPRLSIDLGNSFMIKGFDGPPVPLPSLRAVVVKGDSVEPIDSPFEYTATTNDQHGGVVDFDLTPEQHESLSGNQAAVQADVSGWQTILKEHKSGKYANIDPVTSRAVGGDSIEVHMRAFQWGEPLGDEILELSAPIHVSPGIPVAKPRTLNVTGNLGPGAGKTDGSGRATFTIETPAEMTIPKMRNELDSLAYKLDGPWIGWGGGVYSTGLPIAAVLVWAPYKTAGDPTWEQDVEPVFKEYARMYPGMKSILDISKRSDVVKPENAQAIFNAMSLPMAHPHFMPVTRDLSPQRAAVILAWLKPFLPKKKNG